MAFGSDWAQTVYELAIRCFGPAPMKKQADPANRRRRRSSGQKEGLGETEEEKDEKEKGEGGGDGHKVRKRRKIITIYAKSRDHHLANGEWQACLLETGLLAVS